MTMSNNDIYPGDREDELTMASFGTTHERARAFMREVDKHPTDPTKRWKVIDLKTNTEVYFVLK